MYQLVKAFNCLADDVDSEQQTKKLIAEIKAKPNTDTDDFHCLEYMIDKYEEKIVYLKGKDDIVGVMSLPSLLLSTALAISSSNADINPQKGISNEITNRSSN